MILPRFRKDWGAEWLELWAERAAIIEYDGNLPRSIAERYAEEDTRKTAARSQLNEKAAQAQSR
jgi:hypothetical protein